MCLVNATVYQHMQPVEGIHIFLIPEIYDGWWHLMNGWTDNPIQNSCQHWFSLKHILQYLERSWWYYTLLTIENFLFLQIYIFPLLRFERRITIFVPDWVTISFKYVKFSNCCAERTRKWKFLCNQRWFLDVFWWAWEADPFSYITGNQLRSKYSRNTHHRNTPTSARIVF